VPSLQRPPQRFVDQRRVAALAGRHHHYPPTKKPERLSRRPLYSATLSAFAARIFAIAIDRASVGDLALSILAGFDHHLWHLLRISLAMATPGKVQNKAEFVDGTVRSHWKVRSWPLTTALTTSLFRTTARRSSGDGATSGERSNDGRTGQSRAEC
jgi:hypothetical protein